MTRYLSLLLILTTFSLNTFGQEKPEAPKIPPVKSGQVKPVAPKNTAGDRKFESAISAMDNAANPPKVTLQNGGMTLELKPDTELVREERGLVASDLKVGDELCLIALKGQRSKLSINEKAAVTSLNPITITISDSAKMVLLKDDQWEFYRTTPMKPAELKVGQTVAVQITLRRDGDIIPKRVAVVVGKSQPTKRKPKTPAAPKEKPAGNN